VLSARGKLNVIGLLAESTLEAMRTQGFSEEAMMHRKLKFSIARVIFALFTSFIILGEVNAQTVPVGAGSYTTAVPPGFAGPQSAIFETHGGPIPTHKFWTSKYWNPHGFAPGPVYMFPEPLSIHVTANGLVAGYFPGVNNNGLWFNKPFKPDLTVGVDGLNAGAVNVSRYNDWTADFNFGPITTRVGRGIAYFGECEHRFRPS
jgi:hypothetical protein